MKIKIITLFFILFSLFISEISAQKSNNIIFYGIASNDLESNMVNMTEELFIAQLKELNYSIIDKRYTGFSYDFFSSTWDFLTNTKNEENIFYLIIQKMDDGQWEMQIFFRESASENPKKISKIYDSYYKILMESKTSLNDLLSKLVTSSGTKEITSEKTLTLESLSGNWTGNNYINKIVIMRGGRGFVIFKNGASMNISVRIENDSTIIITQTSSNNASYFPEIDRKAALEKAITAKPITWTFKSSDGKNLKGSVETLIYDQNGNIKEGKLPADWTKISQ